MNNYNDAGLSAQLGMVNQAVQVTNMTTLMELAFMTVRVFVKGLHC